MNISVELSLYPLKNNFVDPILDFINGLKSNQNLKIVTNGMSTQIFGEFNEVMSVLNSEIYKTFTKSETYVVVMKIVNHNLSNYNS